MHDNISIRSIIKNSSKFSGINILSKFIGFPISIIVANVLGPSDFGLLGIVSLYITYAGWMNLGTMGAAYREMPALIKTGNIDKVTKIQNSAISVDFIINFLVFVGLIVISFLQHDRVLKYLLIISSCGFFIARFNYYLGTINFSNLNFNLEAKGKLIEAIGRPILTIGLIFFIGIYSIPISTITISILVLVYLFSVRPYHINFHINKTEWIRQIKIGIALNLGTILYMLFAGVADRTIIATFLSKNELGIYLFAFNIYLIMFEVVADYSRVLQPSIWSVAETADTTQNGFYSLRKMAIYVSLVTAFIIGIAQVGFILLVNLFAKKYVQSQWVFLILVSYLFWGAQQMFPYLVLCSARINKQNIVNINWIIVLLLNIGLDILAIKLGYGIMGIAFITTLTQAIFILSLYSLSSKYMFFSRKEFVSFLIRVLTPFILPVMVTILHWYLFPHINLFFGVSVSIFVQVIIYSFFIKIFYREYFNKKIFLEVLSIVKNKMQPILRRIKLA